MSVALLQQLRSAVGFKKQTDLTTMLSVGDMWSLRQTNTDLIQAQPINEDDEKDLGKDVYATTTFPSHIKADGPWNGRLTIEAATMLACFGIGKVTTKVPAGTGFKYTLHQPDLAADGLDMPSTTWVIQVGDVSDKALIGVCLEDWGLQIKTGSGRDNALFTSQWLGTGAFERPSGITIPTIYDETSLNAGNVTTLSMCGFDYLTNKRFVDVNFGWKNNIRDQSGYFPGSGNQDEYQLRGRMRRGAPSITLKSTVECDSGSSEEDALLDQTEGTGIIEFTAPGADTTYDSIFKITFHRLRVLSTPIKDSDGIASYDVEYKPLKHTSNGVVTIECTLAQDNILTAA